MRCDRCPQRAVTTWTKGWLTLTFCGHYGHEHGAALVAGGWWVTGDGD